MRNKSVVTEATFLGILLAYGFVGPLASLLEQKLVESSKMFECIKVTLLASLNGYCMNKMGIRDAEWRRGSEFALAQLDIGQEALDAMGKTLMKELAAG